MIVWLASYPRSGNTFLRVLLYHAFGLKTCSLHGDVTDIAARSRTSEIVGHIALSRGWSADQARLDDRLWLVKTHELPQGDETAIYVIRDGRETLVSYFNYLQHYSARASNLYSVIEGAVPFGPWSDHVEAWNPLARDNTLLLRFEDLTESPQQHLGQLAQFLSVEPVSRSIPDFAELRATDPSFFRSGRTDSWKTAFDEEHHHLFWLLHGDVMSKYGYTDGMPGVFRAVPSQKPGHPSTVGREQSEALRRLAASLAKHLAEEHRSALRALEAQNRRLGGELAAMRSSLSWKITTPLRALSRILRKLRL
jgi:hypothetical protein